MIAQTLLLFYPLCRYYKRLYIFIITQSYIYLWFATHTQRKSKNYSLVELSCLLLFCLQKECDSRRVNIDNWFPDVLVYRRRMCISRWYIGQISQEGVSRRRTRRLEANRCVMLSFESTLVLKISWIVHQGFIEHIVSASRRIIYGYCHGISFVLYTQSIFLGCVFNLDLILISLIL